MCRIWNPNLLQQGYDVDSSTSFKIHEKADLLMYIIKVFLTPRWADKLDFDKYVGFMKQNDLLTVAAEIKRIKRAI